MHGFYQGLYFKSFCSAVLLHGTIEDIGGERLVWSQLEVLCRLFYIQLPVHPVGRVERLSRLSEVTCITYYSLLSFQLMEINTNVSVAAESHEWTTHHKTTSEHNASSGG